MRSESENFLAAARLNKTDYPSLHRDYKQLSLKNHRPPALNTERQKYRDVSAWP